MCWKSIKNDYNIVCNINIVYLALVTTRYSVNFMLNTCMGAHMIFSGVGKLGVKSPSGVQGRGPGGGLEAKPREADDSLWK